MTKQEKGRIAAIVQRAAEGKNGHYILTAILEAIEEYDRIQTESRTGMRDWMDVDATLGRITGDKAL